MRRPGPSVRRRAPVATTAPACPRFPPASSTDIPARQLPCQPPAEARYLLALTVVTNLEGRTNAGSLIRTRGKSPQGSRLQVDSQVDKAARRVTRVNLERHSPFQAPICIAFPVACITFRGEATRLKSTRDWDLKRSAPARRTRSRPLGPKTSGHHPTTHGENPQCHPPLASAAAGSRAHARPRLRPRAARMPPRTPAAGSTAMRRT